MKDLTPRVASPGLDRRVVAPEGVLAKEMDGEAVLLHLSTETYFGLNATGFRMWRVLTSEPSIAAGIDALVAEYDVAPDELRRDVLELLGELERNGLVRIGHA